MELRWAKLTAAHLKSFQGFCCGDRKFHLDLDEFLLQDALPQGEKRLNATYVFYDTSDRPVGYAALCMSEVDNEKTRPVLADAPYAHVPALLIGRLAIDKRCQRTGYGSSIMKWIRASVETMQVGCRFLAVHVDTRNESAMRFYEREDFFKLGEPDRKQQLLVYDLIG